MSRAVVWEAPLFENDPRAEGCPEDRAAWIGSMKGTFEILGDIVSPANDEDEWEVLRD